MMKRGRKEYTSKYRGVSWNQKKKVWKAAIQVQNDKIYLGRYDYEEDAAHAYNRKAMELKGAAARLNDISHGTRTRYPPGFCCVGDLVLTEYEVWLMEGLDDHAWHEVVWGDSTA